MENRVDWEEKPQKKQINLIELNSKFIVIYLNLEFDSTLFFILTSLSIHLCLNLKWIKLNFKVKFNPGWPTVGQRWFGIETVFFFKVCVNRSTNRYAQSTFPQTQEAGKLERGGKKKKSLTKI